MGGCRLCKDRKGRTGAAGLEGQQPELDGVEFARVAVPDLSYRCLLCGPVTQLLPHDRKEGQMKIF